MPAAVLDRNWLRGITGARRIGLQEIDAVIETAGTIPNPSPSSPLFSSVLLLEFPDSAGEFGFDFALPASAHAAIAAGQGIYLRNALGESVRVSRLADFPDFVAEPTAAEPRNVRHSNPFGIVGSNTGIAVVDAAFNRLWTVAVTPTLGAPVALANFAPVPNTVSSNCSPDGLVVNAIEVFLEKIKLRGWAT